MLKKIEEEVVAGCNFWRVKVASSYNLFLICL